jgi:hypothetical protein
MQGDSPQARSVQLSTARLSTDRQQQLVTSTRATTVAGSVSVSATAATVEFAVSRSDVEWYAPLHSLHCAH